MARKLCDLRWRHQQLKLFHAWKAFSGSQRASIQISRSLLKDSRRYPEASGQQNLGPLRPQVLCWLLRFWRLTTLSNPSKSSTKLLQSRAARLRLEQRAAAHFFAVARQDELSYRCQLRVLRAWREGKVEKGDAPVMHFAAHKLQMTGDQCAQVFLMMPYSRMLPVCISCCMQTTRLRPVGLGCVP